MRTHEFINEDSFIPPHFRKRLEKKGYNFLGQGYDQAAFTVPTDSKLILKIFGHNDDLGARHSMFFKWAEFCKKHSNNPFLPKFSGFERVTIDDKRYIMMYQEKLSYDPEISEAMRRISNAVEERANGIEPGNTITTKGYQDDEKILAAKGVDVAKLISTLTQLYKISKANGYEFDAYGDNILVRSNGQPVIHDPWV
jgi:hypothetical protein